MATKINHHYYPFTSTIIIDDIENIYPSLYLGGFKGSAFEAWGFIDVNDNSVYGGSYGINIALFREQIIKQTRETNIYSKKGPYNIPVMLDSTLPWCYVGFPPPVMSNCCINRHDGCVNSLFLDWSVRKVGLKELWKLKWHEKFDTNNRWTLAGGVQPEDWPEWMRGFKDY